MIDHHDYQDFAEKELRAEQIDQRTRERVEQNRSHPIQRESFEEKRLRRKREREAEESKRAQEIFPLGFEPSNRVFPCSSCDGYGGAKHIHFGRLCWREWCVSCDGTGWTNGSVWRPKQKETTNESAIEQPLRNAAVGEPERTSEGSRASAG